jgi:hypothetical protein
MIRITCSILCYNYGRYLGTAIESCLQQTPGAYEMDILVIDDGSTDETPEVCARYASKIRVVRSANEGFGSTLTRAIALATGDYVALLDADDCFRPDKIVMLLPWLNTRPLYINHRAAWIDESGARIDQESHVCPTSGLCLRRDAALTLLPVDNELHFMPLDLPGKSVHLDQPLTYYRVHRSSMQRNSVPGAWQIRLAAVHRSFLRRIDCLQARPPFWLTSQQRLIELKADAAVSAAFCELEASLQLGDRSAAVMNVIRLGAMVVKHGRGGVLLLKMLLRTIFCIPVFRVKC